MGDIPHSLLGWGGPGDPALPLNKFRKNKELEGSIGLGLLHPTALVAGFREQFQLPGKIMKGILIPRKAPQVQ